MIKLPEGTVPALSQKVITHNSPAGAQVEPAWIRGVCSLYSLVTTFRKEAPEIRVVRGAVCEALKGNPTVREREPRALLTKKMKNGKRPGNECRLLQPISRSGAGARQGQPSQKQCSL